MCFMTKKPKEAAEARCLLSQFATFDHLLMLFCLDDLLLHINPLSVYLQTKLIDLSKCLCLLNAQKIK